MIPLHEMLTLATGFLSGISWYIWGAIAALVLLYYFFNAIVNLNEEYDLEPALLKELLGVGIGACTGGFWGCVISLAWKPLPLWAFLGFMVLVGAVALFFMGSPFRIKR